MHHSFHISVPPAYTDDLLRRLANHDHVVSVSVQRGASVKPRGDVVEVHALNRGSDRLLRLLEEGREFGDLSIASSTVESVIDPHHEKQVAGDVDETVWEDMETSLRHHSQLSVNFLLSMALGGVIAASALLMTTTTQSTALVAAAVIAPGFEPLAKLPMAAVLRRGELALRGLRSTVAGYFVLIAAAALTMALLDAGGYPLPEKLLHNSLTHELTHPTALTLVISAAGALAGPTLIAAHRVALLPGPLIALQLVPAGALAGAAFAMGHGHEGAQALGRMAIDFGFVFVGGLLVFGAKQALTHRRKPVV